MVSLTNKGETVESLMAKGLTRVQAIRMLYEKSGKDSDLKPSPRSPSQKVITRKEITRIDSARFSSEKSHPHVPSKTTDTRVETFDDIRRENMKDDDDVASTPSSLSEDTFFREMSHSNSRYEVKHKQERQKPKTRRSPHASHPPHSSHPAYPPQPIPQPLSQAQEAENYLARSDFLRDEREEFLFLLEQGFSIEVAGEFIIMRRQNIFLRTASGEEERGVGGGLGGVVGAGVGGKGGVERERSAPALPPPPAYEEVTRERVIIPPPITIPTNPPPAASHPPSRPSSKPPTPTSKPSTPTHHPTKSPGRLAPLRVDALSGDLDQDLSLLLSHNYDIEEAREICLSVYAKRASSRGAVAPAPDDFPDGKGAPIRPLVRVPDNDDESSGVGERDEEADEEEREAEEEEEEEEDDDDDEEEEVVPPHRAPSPHPVTKKILQRMVMGGEGGSREGSKGGSVERSRERGDSLSSRPLLPPSSPHLSSVSPSLRPPSISIGEREEIDRRARSPQIGEKKQTPAVFPREVPRSQRGERVVALERGRSEKGVALRETVGEKPKDVSEEVGEGNDYSISLSLLVVEQERVFGCNMYTSLSEADEKVIGEMVRAGKSVDQACLSLFEERYGKVEERAGRSREGSSKASSPRMAPSPRLAPSPQSHHLAPPVPAPEPINLEGAEQLEREILLLMISGYSREQAVQILLDRKMGKQPPLPSVAVPAPSVPVPAARAPTPSKTYPPPTPVPVPVSAPAPAPALEIDVPDLRNSFRESRNSSSRRLHNTQSSNNNFIRSSSPYGRPRGGGGGAGYYDPYPPAPAPVSTPYYEESYAYMGAGGYPASSYLSDPYGRSNYSSYPQDGAYGSPTYPPAPAPYPSPYSSSPHHAHQPPPLINQPLSSLPPDERALQVALLLSEQESKYGVNMFESMGTGAEGSEDYVALDQLRGQGYEEDEALLILFESKVRGGRIKEKEEWKEKQKPPKKAESPEVLAALRLSEAEHRSRPGVEKVSGSGRTPVGAGPTSPQGPSYPLDLGDTSDLPAEAMETLQGMGFSEAQAGHALRIHNYDLFDATHYLLGNQ